MSRPRDNEPMSLQEARKVIRYRRGWRSLLNNLEAREILHGKPFVTRRRGKRGVTRYTVTVSSLRRHAPDLLPTEIRGEGVDTSPTVDGMSLRRMRGALHVLDERIEEGCVEVVENRVEPRLERLEAEVFKKTGSDRNR